VSPAGGHFTDVPTTQPGTGPTPRSVQRREREREIRRSCTCCVKHSSDQIGLELTRKIAQNEPRTPQDPSQEMTVYPSVLFPFVSFATALLPFLSCGDLRRLEQVSIGDHRATEELWSLCTRQIDAVTEATGHCPLMDCIRAQTNPIWTAAATSLCRHKLRGWLTQYEFEPYASYTLRIALDKNVTVRLAPDTIPTNHSTLSTPSSRNWRIQIYAEPHVNGQGVVALAPLLRTLDAEGDEYAPRLTPRHSQDTLSWGAPLVVQNLVPHSRSRSNPMHPSRVAAPCTTVRTANKCGWKD
jgi:hypothetical protein